MQQGKNGIVNSSLRYGGTYHGRFLTQRGGEKVVSPKLERSRAQCKEPSGLLGSSSVSIPSSTTSAGSVYEIEPRNKKDWYGAGCGNSCNFVNSKFIQKF